MPYLRGFKNRWRVEYQVINVGELNELPDNQELTVEILIETGVITKHKPLKILGDGELARPLTVHAHKFSGSAREKIEAAGGTIVEVEWAHPRSSRSRGPNPPVRNTESVNG